MAARPSLFCLIKKGRKKSSSLKALPCGHHSKKQAIIHKPIASLFVHYAASEQKNNSSISYKGLIKFNLKTLNQRSVLNP
jgi:hypothetical protein